MPPTVPLSLPIHSWGYSLTQPLRFFLSSNTHRPPTNFQLATSCPISVRTESSPAPNTAPGAVPHALSPLLHQPNMLAIHTPKQGQPLLGYTRPHPRDLPNHSWMARHHPISCLHPSASRLPDYPQHLSPLCGRLWGLWAQEKSPSSCPQGLEQLRTRELSAMKCPTHVPSYAATTNTRACQTQVAGVAKKKF